MEKRLKQAFICQLEFSINAFISVCLTKNSNKKRTCVYALMLNTTVHLILENQGYV